MLYESGDNIFWSHLLPNTISLWLIHVLFLCDTCLTFMPSPPFDDPMSWNCLWEHLWGVVYIYMVTLPVDTLLKKIVSPPLASIYFLQILRKVWVPWTPLPTPSFVFIVEVMIDSASSRGKGPCYSTTRVHFFYLLHFFFHVSSWGFRCGEWILLGIVLRSFMLHSSKNLFVSCSCLKILWETDLKQ